MILLNCKLEFIDWLMILLYYKLEVIDWLMILLYCKLEAIDWLMILLYCKFESFAADNGKKINTFFVCLFWFPRVSLRNRFLCKLFYHDINMDSLLLSMWRQCSTCIKGHCKVIVQGFGSFWFTNSDTYIIFLLLITLTLKGKNSFIH